MFPLKRILFLCPISKRPSGGVRYIYECVSALRQAGFDAYVYPEHKSFKVSWFPESVPHFKGPINSGDLIVIPEMMVPYIALSKLKLINYVILVQNGYYVLDEIRGSLVQRNIDIDEKYFGARSIISISSYTTRILEFLFPGVTILAACGVPFVSNFQSQKKEKLIIFMSRKNRLTARSVVYPLLKYVSQGWRFIDVSEDFVNEQDLKQLLSRAYIFLSFGTREGFNSPPLEAYLAGCHVIGFHGFGALDYWEGEGFCAIEEGDLVSFVDQVEARMAQFSDEVSGGRSTGFTIDKARERIQSIFFTILNSMPSDKTASSYKLMLQKSKPHLLLNRISRKLRLVMGG